MNTETPARPHAWVARLSVGQEMTLVLLFTTVLWLVTNFVRYRSDGAASLSAVTSSRVLQTLGMQVVVAAILGLVLVKRGWPLKQILGRLALRDLWSGIAVFAVMLLTAGLLAFGLVALRHAGVIGPSPVTTHTTVVVAIVAAVINPVFEELLWLGYWYRALESRSPVLAGAVSIGLRTLAHVWKGFVGALTVIPMGVIFTVYYGHTRRLWPLIITHAMMDALSIISLSHMAAAATK